jgi:hypothetical protein
MYTGDEDFGWFNCEMLLIVFKSKRVKLGTFNTKTKLL